MTVALSSGDKNADEHDVPRESSAALQAGSEAAKVPTPETPGIPTPADESRQTEKSTTERTSNGGSPSSDRVGDEQAAVQKVQVLFETEPAGATVFRGEQRISSKKTPFTMPLPRDSIPGIYVFKKPGFTATQKTIETDPLRHDMTIRAALKPSKKSRKKTRSSNPLRRRER